MLYFVVIVEEMLLFSSTGASRINTMFKFLVGALIANYFSQKTIQIHCFQLLRCDFF